MSDVEIELSGRSSGRVLVDGHDLAPAVNGLVLRAEIGRTPHLELRLNVHETTRLGAQQAEVVIDPSSAAFLERAGWTPPPGVPSQLRRDTEGCPCARIDVTVNGPPGTETILGHIVPTCPVHGVNARERKEFVHRDHLHAQQADQERDQ